MLPRIAVAGFTLVVCVSAFRLDNRTVDEDEAPFLSAKRRSIRLIVARHGMSCHNVVNDYGGSKEKAAVSTLIPDPVLSDCGISQLKNARSLLKNEKIDFIGSSQMLRSIEAAWHLFAYHPVTVFPHISEPVQDDEPSNVPLAANNQQEILKSMYPNMDVTYDWLLKNNNKDPSSWSHFETFLERELLPGLNIKGKKSAFTIAFVTHGGFMHDSLFSHESDRTREGICRAQSPSWLSGKFEMPYPGQMVEIFYSFDVVKGKLTLDTQRGCRSLGSNTFRPLGAIAQPKQICLQDFHRCMERAPFNFESMLGDKYLNGQICQCEV